MGKDIDLLQAVRDEDLSLLQKLLDRTRTQRSSKFSSGERLNFRLFKLKLQAVN